LRFLSLLVVGKRQGRRENVREDTFRILNVHEKKHVSEKSRREVWPQREVNPLKIRRLQKTILAYRRNRRNCENEGITLNVAENKGATLLTLSITLNVYEK